MNKWPHEVSLYNLTNPDSDINQAVGLERLIVSVRMPDITVLDAFFAELAAARDEFPLRYRQGVDYTTRTNLTAVTDPSGHKATLLNLQSNLVTDEAPVIYEQLNPGFWKMKTLGLWEQVPAFTLGDALQQKWYTLIDITT